MDDQEQRQPTAETMPPGYEKHVPIAVVTGNLRVLAEAARSHHRSESEPPPSGEKG